ncbi:uncharacterized protein LOC134844470 [Symsagittifera roscoffensis]|uniref:uncharacterized protein LOC134844470 n=1 Tax=Symsagittifera roscoffensis TaxID=84072 RepID=UPI00307C7481
MDHVQIQQQMSLISKDQIYPHVVEKVGNRVRPESTHRAERQTIENWQHTSNQTVRIEAQNTASNKPDDQLRQLPLEATNHFATLIQNQYLFKLNPAVIQAQKDIKCAEMSESSHLLDDRKRKNNHDESTDEKEKSCRGGMKKNDVPKGSCLEIQTVQLPMMFTAGAPVLLEDLLCKSEVSIIRKRNEFFRPALKVINRSPANQPPSHPHVPSISVTLNLLENDHACLSQTKRSKLHLQSIS